jgi:cytochrome c-type biogenesis protein CcmH/NrfF
MKHLILAVLAFLLAQPVLADSSLPPAPYAYRQLENPAQEQEAKALMETIRCLQCQGQSIADSDAPIRERIKAGEQPEAIRAWLVERYGDYVSYAPQMTSKTWPLYAAPLALLALAFLIARRRFIGRAGQ